MRTTMIGGIFDGHHLVLSVRTIEPVALSRRHISLGIVRLRLLSFQDRRFVSQEKVPGIPESLRVVRFTLIF